MQNFYGTLQRYLVAGVGVVFKFEILLNCAVFQSTINCQNFFVFDFTTNNYIKCF